MSIQSTKVSKEGLSLLLVFLDIGIVTKEMISEATLIVVEGGEPVLVLGSIALILPTPQSQDLVTASSTDHAGKVAILVRLGKVLPQVLRAVPAKLECGLKDHMDKGLLTNTVGIEPITLGNAANHTLASLKHLATPLLLLVELVATLRKLVQKVLGVLLKVLDMKQSIREQLGCHARRKKPSGSSVRLHLVMGGEVGSLVGSNLLPSKSRVGAVGAGESLGIMGDTSLSAFFCGGKGGHGF
mmetsp:Transcript_1990/g.3790  ORF Transcript_1990/g.3790 Transcript_1990/m.3790 type:complete len:242 (-) Transcript_1990:106-831(-)